jgi:WG containing repeat
MPCAARLVALLDLSNRLKANPRCCRNLAFATLCFFFMGTMLFAQKGPGTQGQPQQNSPGSPTSPGGNAPSSPGITGGTDPIESVLFAYKALASDGAAISSQINGLLQPQDKSIVVIATPTDVSALVQWRAVTGQLDLLRKRVDESDRLARPTIPTYSNAVASSGPVSGRFGLIASAGDIQTLAQTALTLASAFAVTESLSPSTGAITDAPLMNVVARDLRSAKVQVYIPSVYTPNLLRNSALDNTFIWVKLQDLESKRTHTLSEIQKYLQALDDAKTVAASVPASETGQTAGRTPPPRVPAAGGYTDADRRAAKNFANEEKTITALVADLNSIVAAIDTFEGSLFSGQTASPSSGNPNANANNNQNGTPTGPQGPTGPAATTMGTGGPAAPSPSPAPQPSPGPSPQLAGGNQQGGTTLQQIMLGDLLAHQVWNGADPPADDVLDQIHILSVHALESGGGQLSKSWLFTGNRFYFSGGAVANFALYGVNGGIECAGFAYDYSGYVREKNFEAALRAPKPTAAVITTDGSCLLSPVSESAQNEGGPKPPSRRLKAAPGNIPASGNTPGPSLSLPAPTNGKTGYINAQGEYVINPQFTRGDDFSEGLAAAYKQGPDDFFPVAGYINTSGNWVISPQFDWAGPFHEGFARVKLNDTYGSHAFVTPQGKVIPVPNGDVNGMTLGDVVEGLAAYSPDGNQFGFIDPAGSVVIQPHFENVDAFSEGLALVKTAEGFGFIDKTGAFAFAQKFAVATDFHNGHALVCIEQKKNCGSIDNKGQLAPINKVLSFDRWWSSPNVSRPPDASGLHVMEGARGYMDEKGNVAIAPKYFKSWEFSEGLAAQTLDVFGKCGYIDTTGAMVIAPIYDDCGEFVNGLAFVGGVDRRSEYRRGYIDKSGKTLWSSK